MIIKPNETVEDFAGRVFVLEKDTTPDVGRVAMALILTEAHAIAIGDFVNIPYAAPDETLGNMAFRRIA